MNEKIGNTIGATEILEVVDLTSSSTQFAAAKAMLDHVPWTICNTGSGIGAKRSGDVSQPLSIASLSPAANALAKLLDIEESTRISPPILGKVNDSSDGGVSVSLAVPDSLSNKPKGCDAMPSKALMCWSLGSAAKT